MRVFAALVDPPTLQKCIPGCEEMHLTPEGHYSAKLSAGVGPIKGVFNASIAMRDIRSPEHYKLVVEGKGQPGFVKGSGELTLEEDGATTVIRYSGELNVGGMLASVGQRMIQSAANMMAGRFFTALENEVRTVETTGTA